MICDSARTFSVLFVFCVFLSFRGSLSYIRHTARVDPQPHVALVCLAVHSEARLTTWGSTAASRWSICRSQAPSYHSQMWYLLGHFCCVSVKSLGTAVWLFKKRFIICWSWAVSSTGFDIGKGLLEACNLTLAACTAVSRDSVC